jgi:hypothetical protein
MAGDGFGVGAGAFAGADLLGVGVGFAGAVALEGVGAAVLAGTDVVVGAAQTKPADIAPSKPSVAKNSLCGECMGLLIRAFALGGSDDLGDADAEVIINHDDLAASDEQTVREQVYRFPCNFVQLNDGTGRQV